MKSPASRLSLCSSLQGQSAVDLGGSLSQRALALCIGNANDCRLCYLHTIVLH
jgi:hypothetical protein